MIEFNGQNELFVPTSGFVDGNVYRFLLGPAGELIPNGVIQIPGSAAGVAFAPNGEMFVTSNVGNMLRFTFDVEGNAVPNGELPFKGLGAPAIVSLRTFTATHTYLDDNPTGTSSDDYAITVTVTDDDGGVGEADATVTVNNVAPSVAITAIPIIVSLGQPFTLQAIASDVGVQDAIQLEWLVTRNGATVATGAGEEFTFTPLEQGIHLFTLTGTDDDGGVGTAQVALEVEPCQLPGDTNGDCVIDVVDLNNVRNNFGETGLGAVDLSFNAPIPGTITDKDGLGTGFTHRLPGTGTALPANDPNLDLEPGGGGRLRIRSTQADINGALNLSQLEAPGVELNDIRDVDLRLSILLDNVQLPNASDQITIYFAPDASTTLRAGVHNGNVFVFSTNVGDGDVNVTSAPNAFDSGDDLELTLARTNGVWALSWTNLSEPGQDGSLPGQELPWLNEHTQLYAGVLVANARSATPFTAVVDDFTLDVLRQIPGDTNDDFIVDLVDLNAVRNNFGTSFPAPPAGASAREASFAQQGPASDLADAVFSRFALESEGTLREWTPGSSLGKRRR